MGFEMLEIARSVVAKFVCRSVTGSVDLGDDTHRDAAKAPAILRQAHGV